MATRDEVTSILAGALEQEKRAEENCARLLEEFALNGFRELVDHIKNDEVHHQEMVRRLMTLS